MSKITIPLAGPEVYTDAMGRQQWRVVGPNGTFLVTRSDRFATWEVWRSDSLNTLARSRDLQSALKDAAYYANAGH